MLGRVSLVAFNGGQWHVMLSNPSASCTQHSSQQTVEEFTADWNGTQDGNPTLDAGSGRSLAVHQSPASQRAATPAGGRAPPAFCGARPLVPCQIPATASLCLPSLTLPRPVLGLVLVDLAWSLLGVVSQAEITLATQARCRGDDKNAKRHMIDLFALALSESGCLRVGGGEFLNCLLQVHILL